MDDFDVGFQRAIFASMQMHTAMTRAAFGAPASRVVSRDPPRPRPTPAPAPRITRDIRPTLPSTRRGGGAAGGPSGPVQQRGTLAREGIQPARAAARSTSLPAGGIRRGGGGGGATRLRAPSGEGQQWSVVRGDPVQVMNDSYEFTATAAGSSAANGVVSTTGGVGTHTITVKGYLQAPAGSFTVAAPARLFMGVSLGPSVSGKATGVLLTCTKEEDTVHPHVDAAVVVVEISDLQSSASVIAETRVVRDPELDSLGSSAITRSGSGKGGSPIPLSLTFVATGSLSSPASLTLQTCEVDGNAFTQHQQVSLPAPVNLMRGWACVVAGSARCSATSLAVVAADEPRSPVPRSSAAGNAPPRSSQARQRTTAAAAEPPSRAGRAAGAAAPARGTKPPGAAPSGDEDPFLAQVERDLLDTSPGVQWEDVAANGDAKRLLNEAVVLPVVMPELFTGLRTPWKGVLLFGPPGTGKTMLAKAVATSGKSSFYNTGASSLLSRYHGESEKLIKALFTSARNKSPATIFIDEVDALVRTRSTGDEQEVSRRVKAELLQQIDGVPTGGGDGGGDGPPRVLVLCTTNTPWDLDDALIRRLEKRIYVPLPDQAGRVDMVRHMTRSAHVAPDVDFDAIAEQTDGYSGADLAGVCKEAAMASMRRVIDGKSPSELMALKEAGGLSPDALAITQADFVNTIARVKPSVPSHTIQRYLDWNASHGSI